MILEVIQNELLSNSTLVFCFVFIVVVDDDHDVVAVVLCTKYDLSQVESES